MSQEYQQTNASRFLCLAAMMFIAFMFANSAPASAQCTSTGNGADFSNQYNIVFQAATTQQGCSGRTVKVAGWIQGAYSDCQNETTDSMGNCYDENGSTNAIVVMIADPRTC